MKKRNEDNHNNLGEPDDQLSDETLKMINELLERLHRLRDLNIIKLKKEKIEEENNEKYEREKSVQINIYEKGSQHIDTQINWGASPPAQASPPTPASPLTPLQLARGKACGGEGESLLRRALVKVHVALNPTNIHLLFHTSQIY